MIIICPCCKKKFEIDQNLIPEKGRLLQCGFCDEKWFFNKNDKQIPEPRIIEENNIVKSSNDNETISKKIEIDASDQTDNIEKNKSSFSFSNFLSYILVSIISFVAIIILIDTLKTPLYEIFPQLETILFNLFETIKDIKLFIKDLF